MLWNKIEMSEQINESLDMLVTPQQILENSFTDGQARIPATQFRKHFWSTFGRRLMIFLIDDIPSKLLSVEAEPVESWISKREDLFLCFLRFLQRLFIKALCSFQKQFKFIHFSVWQYDSWGSFSSEIDDANIKTLNRLS